MQNLLVHLLPSVFLTQECCQFRADQLQSNLACPCRFETSVIDEPSPLTSSQANSNPKVFARRSPSKFVPRTFCLPRSHDIHFCSYAHLQRTILHLFHQRAEASVPKIRIPASWWLLSLCCAVLSVWGRSFWHSLFCGATSYWRAVHLILAATSRSMEYSWSLIHRLNWDFLSSDFHHLS